MASPLALGILSGSAAFGTVFVLLTHSLNLHAVATLSGSGIGFAAFSWFSLRTFRRGRSRIDVLDSAIRYTPGKGPSVEIAWSQIREAIWHRFGPVPHLLLAGPSGAEVRVNLDLGGSSELLALLADRVPCCQASLPFVVEAGSRRVLLAIAAAASVVLAAASVALLATGGPSFFFVTLIAGGGVGSLALLLLLFGAHSFSIMSDGIRIGRWLGAEWLPISEIGDVRIGVTAGRVRLPNVEVLVGGGWRSVLHLLADPLGVYNAIRLARARR